jgi:hypothetical protein
MPPCSTPSGGNSGGNFFVGPRHANDSAWPIEPHTAPPLIADMRENLRTPPSKKTASMIVAGICSISRPPTDAPPID